MKKSFKRIDSLDILRGVAIMIMLLLSAPPDDEVFAILKHAQWSGINLPDVAFPMFAFAMGAGAAISISRRKTSTRKIFRRAAILFALGLFLNFTANIFSLTFVHGLTAENFFDVVIEHGRPFGILQRLAITYLFAVMLARSIKDELGILIATFFLLGVSSAGFHLYSHDNPFDEAHNISRAVDYIFPGANHIYTPTHDPEGLYGCIAGTASVLFGYLAGKVLIKNVPVSRKIFLLSAAGFVLMILGTLWSFPDIVSKKLWTAPFTLLNAGGDALLLALFMKLLNDFSGAKKFFRPLKALGMNPLFFFSANCLLLDLLTTIPSMTDGLVIYNALYYHTTRGFISPEVGGTLFCMLWTLIWFPLAEMFYRRGITIKI